MMSADNPPKAMLAKARKLGEQNRAATNHTPGPWHVSPPPGVVLVVDDHGIAIVECLDRGTETPYIKANARLIAAAPEMFKALEDLLAYLREFWPLEPLFSTYDDRQAIAIADAEAALRKAKGE